MSNRDLVSEMIDRVAKAMWNAEDVAFGWAENERTIPWEDAVERGLYGVGAFRIFARAAVEEMLELTKKLPPSHMLRSYYDAETGTIQTEVVAPNDYLLITEETGSVA